MLQLLFRMKEGCRFKGPHVIRLQNKRVEVQLEYHSPPKKERMPKVCEVDLYRVGGKREDEQKSSKKIHHLNSFKSIKRMQIANSSPFYYLKAIEESQPIIADYEKFHQRMVENEAQPIRLKVYSNSKELKKAKENLFSKVAAKNGPNSKPIKDATNNHVPLRKIKLYSPIKVRPQQKENCVALKEKSNSLQNSSFPDHIKLKGTPERRRKLEVTSSKSRNKQDSMLSREQKSIEATRQLKSRLEEETPSRFPQSFHSMSLHEH